MVATSRSARLFLERVGIRPTLRGPLPRFAPQLTEDTAWRVGIPRPWPRPSRTEPDEGLASIWPRADSEVPRG